MNKKLITTGGKIVGGIFAAMVGKDMIRQGAGKTFVGITTGFQPTVIAGGGAIMFLGCYYAATNCIGLVADILEETNEETNEETPKFSKTYIPPENSTILGLDDENNNGRQRNDKGQFIKTDSVLES